MTKANQITNLQIVKETLDDLKPKNKYIDNFVENSYEYEGLCEEVGEQLCEIDEALIGKEMINLDSMARADIRMTAYWDYLKGKIDFKKLMKILKEESYGLLLQ